MKREQTVKAGILLFSLASILYAFSDMDFGRSQYYEDSLINEADYQAIIAEREQLAEVSIPELHFNDYPIQFDSLSSTYLYSLVENNPARSNPSMRVVSQDFSRYDIAIVGDILNDEDMSPNAQAALIVYDDDYYKEFSLSATTLPIVSVSMHERVEDRDNPIGAPEKRAHFELFDNRSDASSSERVVKSQTYIRHRGASSLRFPKKQFRVKLREFSIGGDVSNNNLSLLGLREDDDWILYSPYNDPEKMRNTLSNNLWHDVMAENNPHDVNTGTEGRFVEVFIDGKYWGVYTLLHPIDAKQLDLTRKNSPESDFYYRSYSHREFDIDDFTHFDTGYRRGRFELRDPEPNGQPYQWEPLVKHMESLDFDQAGLRTYVEDYAYLPNLIDYYLFFILLQATDNDTKNHNYIARFEGETHRMIESPWDLDLTWGLRWRENHDRLSDVSRDVTHNPQPGQSHVTRSIQNGDQEVIDMVKDRYSELRATDWSEESLMGRIDAFESDLYHSGASLRDFSRWPDSAFNPDTEELRTYMLTRLTLMDEFLEELLGGETHNE